jgi:hypothetical protein
VIASCLAALAGIGAAVAVSACQSSQAKNSELAKRGATILKKEQGLQVNQTNSNVKVLDTTVLSDSNGSAVVVTLKNDSQQALMDVPIAINVKDAKGKSVFKNDDPGLDPTLVSVPQMLPGETVDWVDDQILAAGTPKSVDVKVGVSQDPLPPNPPKVEASAPKLKNDPYLRGRAQGRPDRRGGARRDQGRRPRRGHPPVPHLLHRQPKGGAGDGHRPTVHLRIGSIPWQRSKH